MVEQDVIYEEIKFQRSQQDGDARIDSSSPPYSQPTDSIEPSVEDEYLHDRLYEDMNGLGEELAREYNIHSIHETTSNSENFTYTTNNNQHSKQQNDGDSYFLTNSSGHVRDSSSSSSENSYNSSLYGKHRFPQNQQQYQQQNNKLKRPSVDDLGIARTFSFHDNEIIYTEIVTDQDTTEEITTGRITRESDNPVLRQSKFCSDKKAASLNNIDMSPVLDECLYGSIDHINFQHLKVRSLDRRKNNKNNRNSMSLYENSNRISAAFSSIIPNEDIYENSKSTALDKRNEEDISSRQKVCSSCGELQKTAQQQQDEQPSQGMRSTESANSLYENVNELEDIYEKLSDNEWTGDEQLRQRSLSKPIDILQITGTAPISRPNLKRSDGSFDDNEYNKKNVAPFSVSSMSSSVTSSPRGSICDSISSDISSILPRSTTPPPLPLSRKRNTGNTSWSNMSAFAGLNYFPANYLGKQQVSKATRDSIDLAVSHVAQHTNLLEMKPVHTEVSHELIRIGCNSSPWELLETFTIEDVITYDVITKNVPFLGILAGKPGCEAYCYVLQSDKSQEIGDAIKDAFQTVPNKFQRSQSSYEVNIQPEFHRFHFLVKIGSTKVRRSFHCVNDYINLVLEKENPKDFRSVNLEVLGSNVVISDTFTKEETSHSAPSILSLGVYSKDKRYFGYIITEVSENKKERVQCYVYRAARNNTAAKIIDAISTSYQIAYAPRVSDICEVNPIYAPGLHSTNNSSPNSIYSKYIKPTLSEDRKFRRNSARTASTQCAQNTQINPLYARHGKPPVPCTDAVGRKSGRNSVVSITSNVSSQPSLSYSINSSPDTSPKSDRYDNFNRKALSSRIVNSLSITDRRLSMNLDAAPQARNEKSTLLIDISGSTETLLTLTPSNNSYSSLPRSSPITKKERPKSLPLLDFYTDGEMLDYNREDNSKIPSKSRRGTADHRKPKHKTLFGKLRGSMKVKHSLVPIQTEILPDTDINNSYNELPSPGYGDVLKSSTHVFDVAYICSTVVNPPLRPKHVRDCYKQFTKEMTKAGKLSHNNGLKTIGSAVKLKITTGHEITMLDPNDENTVIRNFSVDIFDKYIFHPDPNMGCFAFSTTVPENIKHKCHLFVMPNDLRNGLSDAFNRIEQLKNQRNCENSKLI